MTRAWHERIPTFALVVLISAIWGSNFVAMKLILQYLSPLLMGSLRALIGGLCLLLIVVISGIALPKTGRQWRQIFWIALFMTTLSSACFALGIARVSASLAGLLSNTMPLFTLILAPLLLDERPGVLAWVGLAVGFAGTGVIAWPTLQVGGEVLGIVFVMAAPASWALGSILMKRQRILDGVHPLAVVAIQLLMSSVGIFLLALLFEGGGRFRAAPGLWLPLAYASLPALALAFVMWTEILRRGSAVQASATAYLVPLFGVGFATLWLGERLSSQEILGGLLVLTGVAAVNLPTVFRADRENALAHAAVSDAD